jgi:hypothetical protein
VHERQQTRRSEDGRKQKQSARRTAERKLAEAESAVTKCEARVAAIRALLEDPALYTTASGSVQAQALGIELETARAELEKALAHWETASAAAEGELTSGEDGHKA